MNPAVSRITFLVGWVAAWILSVFIVAGLSSASLAAVDASGFYATLCSLLGFVLLATLQAWLARHCLQIELRHWVRLAALGFVVGQVALAAFHASVERIFPPILYAGSSIIPPESATWPRYILYTSATTLLAWYMPLVFQWLSLRRRYRRHALWLAAIAVCAPLGFYGPDMFLDGLFENAVELLTGVNHHPLEWIAVPLDWLTPAAIMGMTLLFVLDSPVHGKAKRRG